MESGGERAVRVSVPEVLLRRDPAPAGCPADGPGLGREGLPGAAIPYVASGAGGLTRPRTPLRAGAVIAEHPHRWGNRRTERLSHLLSSRSFEPRLSGAGGRGCARWAIPAGSRGDTAGLSHPVWAGAAVNLCLQEFAGDWRSSVATSLSSLQWSRF